MIKSLWYEIVAFEHMDTDTDNWLININDEINTVNNSNNDASSAYKSISAIVAKAT